MCFRVYYIVLILAFLSHSCSKKQQKGINKASLQITKTENINLITPEGDTIPTGKAIPTKGKWINPDSVAEAIKIQLKNPPRVVPTHTNVHLLVKPKAIQILEKFTVSTPGKNGIPLPQKFPTQGKVHQALQTQAISVTVPQMNNNAISNLQYLDVDQGLISSYVRSMLKDDHDNLWLGTLEGLSRFDGSSFTHYTAEEGLSHNSVLSMLKDSKENLWLGTDGGGVNCYNGNSFIHYTTDEGLSHNKVTSMLEDKKGNLWFGTAGGGVNLFDGNSFTHYTIKEGLSHNSVLSMLEDSQGNLWLGTDGGGVCRFDGNNFIHYTFNEDLSNNKVECILEDSKGTLWFGTLKGIIRFAPNIDQNRFYQYTTNEGLSDNHIKSILEDRQGNLWFGTNDRGVNRFDGNSFTYYTTKEGLSLNRVLAMVEDSQGSLWFGTNGGGINRYNENSFIHYSTREGLSYNRVRSIIEDRRGNILFGTAGGSVSQYDGGNFVQYTIQEGLTSYWVESMLDDNKGSLWLGANGAGVIRYDRNSFTQYTTQQGLSDNHVECILEDSQGKIWIGTAGGGVCRFDGSSFIHFTTKEGLSNNRVRCMLEDRRGNLWFGTAGGGVSRFDGNNFIHYTSNEGLNNNFVESMIEDSQGNLWFGTNGGGVSRFDPENESDGFTHYTTEDGLSNDWVWSILEDKKKNIWLSTQKGITLMVPSSANTDSFQFFTFEKKDGLKRLDFELNSACLDFNNQIWWGSFDGLTSLNLNRFELPTAPPKISLNTIAVAQTFIDYRKLHDTSYSNSFSFGEALSYSFDSIAAFSNYPSTMSLPYDINHLTFQFAAIDWAAPHKIKYSYKIEGLDENWSLPNSEPKADYRNLPYGTFTLKFKAIGAAQVWSETFEYTFTILPPWWHRWWAYALYILTFIILIMGFRQYEIKRLRNREEAKRLQELDSVKTKLYNNITHEFRTPLTVIMGMTDELDKKPVEAKRMIRRNSEQLLRLINQMLDLSKLESGKLNLKMQKGDVIPYLQYLTESFHSFAEMKKIQLLFYKEVNEMEMDYDEEKLQHIVSNLLSNAIKFTPEKGEVIVHVNAQQQNGKEELILKVKDNGIGVEADVLPHIFDRFYQVDDSSTRKSTGTGIGLALTKELVQLMKGSISVKSEPGMGTEFIVMLPVSRKASLSPSISTQSKEEMLKSVKPESVTALQNETIEKKESLTSNGLPLLLIIEDNPDVAMYIQTCLEDQYVIEKAENGQIGIDKAIALVPDIIISDVMMPEKDGFEVCDSLKNDERTSHIPIILLTAKATDEDKISGLQKGADAYLIKPFNKNELSIRLQKLIELRQQLQKRYVGISSINIPTDDQQPVEIEDAFLIKMKSIVEKRLDDADFSIPQFCRDAGMSRTQLHRKLKALTDKSATHFIRSIRLQKAKELLQTTDLNVSEIAYEVGFSDPAYFSTSFFEEFGTTPSGTRK